MTRYQPAGPIRRATRYLVRERRDGTRHFRLDTLFFFTALALAVRAWVAPAHWAVCAFGVLASLSFPVFWFVRDGLA